MVLKDKRLMVCAEMVEGDHVCDVGTDHGYLPAYLLSSGRCSHAVCADINPMPLDSARATLARAGVSQNALFCLSDGLRDVPLDGVTDIVIAGMGGELIYKILSEDERVKTCGANFILQPMTRAAELRRSLGSGGFETVCERGAVDGRFAYCIIKCRYTGKIEKPDPVRENIGCLDPAVPEDRLYILRQLDRMCAAAEGMAKSSPEKAAQIMETVEMIRKETRL